MASAPTFYLYGEPHRTVEDGFLHVEDLDHRSRPAGWCIQPHAHRELNHLILIARGGGAMDADGIVTRFHAPSLLLVPAGIVHGFRWLDESVGSVITIATGEREALVRRHPALAELFAEPAALPLGEVAAAAIGAGARTLIRELGWAAPGHRAAVEAALLGVLVEALRSRDRISDGVAPSKQAALVARYRALIEERFRLREPIASLAARLGVSPTTLRAACAVVAGAAPGDIIDMRALLEAKRGLRYTNQSVAEIAYGLGFSDPAYFTRMFTKAIGCSPRRFRRGEPSVQNAAEIENTTFASAIEPPSAFEKLGSR